MALDRVNGQQVKVDQGELHGRTSNWMEQLQARSQEDWLVGLADSRRLAAVARARSEQFSAFVRLEPCPAILLMESDPIDFLGSLIAACTVACPVFLGNPNWTKTEYAQVRSQIGGAIVCSEQKIWKDCSYPSDHGATELDLKATPGNWILLPTGGSSGKIRFAIHTCETLAASVRGFQAYFQVHQVHSCCVLPLYHVSGLMQFLRSLLSGGRFACFENLAAVYNEGNGAIDPTQFFLSLVPTQLARCLRDPQLTPSRSTADQAFLSWLAKFPTILLGGAPAWPALLHAAKHQKLRLAPTYGMTETAAQIATLKPEDFLQGCGGCGQILPHAQVVIRDESGQPLPIRAIGTIAIRAQSLALGYYGELDSRDTESIQNMPAEFETDDLGYFNQAGYLHIVGRKSQKIITGGENVFPAEVEAAIQASGWVEDVCVLGLPDQDWGEVVTAVYVPRLEFSLTALERFLAARFSKFKCPKYWVAVTVLPRNPQGKINLSEVKQMVLELLGEGDSQQSNPSPLANSVNSRVHL